MHGGQCISRRLKEVGMARSLCGDFYTFGPRVPLASNMPIRGRPFSAEYEEVHSRPATGEVVRRHGTIWRDSAGRMGQEDDLDAERGNPEGGGKVVSILDPDGLIAHVFDSRTKEVLELDIGRALRGDKRGPTAATCPVVPGPRAETQSNPSRELLGTRVIEGFPCHGIRMIVGQEEVEDWLSGDLVALLLEVAKSSDFQTTYRLFNIKLGEPETGSFRVVPWAETNS